MSACSKLRDGKEKTQRTITQVIMNNTLFSEEILRRSHHKTWTKYASIWKAIGKRMQAWWQARTRKTKWWSRQIQNIYTSYRRIIQEGLSGTNFKRITWEGLSGGCCTSVIILTHTAVESSSILAPLGMCLLMAGLTRLNPAFRLGAMWGWEGT